MPSDNQCRAFIGRIKHSAHGEHCLSCLRAAVTVGEEPLGILLPVEPDETCPSCKIPYGSPTHESAARWAAEIEAADDALSAEEESK